MFENYHMFFFQDNTDRSALRKAADI